MLDILLRIMYIVQGECNGTKNLMPGDDKIKYENKLHLIERFVKIREEVGSIQKLAENPQISKEELIGKVNEISHRIIEEL